MHDFLIGRAFHSIVGDAHADGGEQQRAEAQARLPVRLGGCGLTKQSSIAEAACVGSWALVWRPMQQLCPQLFGGVDLATAPQEAFAELQRAHARLMEAHARVSGVWKEWDDDFYDYNKDGESCKAFHPEQLATRQELLPITAFGSEDDYLKGAQRRFSSIVHHAAWWKLLQRLRGQDVEARRSARRRRRRPSRGRRAKRRASSRCQALWQLYSYTSLLLYLAARL